MAEATDVVNVDGTDGGRHAMRREGTLAASFRTALIASLVLLGFASILVAVWSVARGGIGWDAHTDTMASLEVRSVDTAWPLARAYRAVYLTSEFYGVFVQQLADLLHTVTTGSTERLAPADSATYLYQGAVTLVLSVVSVTALAGAVAIVFRSMLAGALAWSLTLATPLWLGMSQVDFKDTPLAAGFNLITAGLLLSIATEAPRKAALYGALLACPGAAVALATRPGSLPLLAALLAGTPVVVAGWALARRRPLTALPALVTSCTALVVALAFTWATNPFARIDMVQWLRDASDVARAYPWDGTILTAGVEVRSLDLPWWYVPAWLGAQLPLLTFAALLAGLATLGGALARRRRELGGTRLVAIVPLALQGVVLPIGVVVSGAVLYDGIRHLLFMIPALVALAAVGLALLDGRFGPGSRARVAVPLAAVAVVAASLAASARWAPYAYAFINPIAGRNTDGQSWELDYWGVSAREGIARLRREGLTSIQVQPAPQVGYPYGAEPWTGSFGENAGVYVFYRWGTRASDFGCTVVFTIERDGHALGEGARCPPTAP